MALVAVLALGAGVFHVLNTYPGFVMVAVGTTTITLNLWLSLLLLGLAGGALWLSRGLLRAGGRALGAAGSRFGGNLRARRLTTRGLVDFIEGNWSAGRKQLLRGVGRSDMPLLNYLAAARCSYELGDEAEAMALLHKAGESAPDAALAVALTQARMQVLDGKYEQAAAALQRARKQAPHHPVVLDLLAKVCEALPDWEGLAQILPELRRYKVRGAAELTRLTRLLHGARLQQAIDTALRQRSAAGLKDLHKCWKQLDHSLQADPALLHSYVHGLQQLGQDDRAEQILRETLGSAWSAAAILSYGRLKTSEPQRQLLAAEAWLTARPASAELLLTLGRLCLRNQLWGKARDYFERSLRIQVRADTCAELARLLASLGEHRKSTEYYQTGLLQLSETLPDLPQPAASTLSKF